MIYAALGIGFRYGNAVDWIHYCYCNYIGNFSTSFKVNAQAKWSAVAVGGILKDEIYTGVMVQGKSGTPNHKVKKNFIKPSEDWARVYNTHESIISREEFMLVNQLLSNDTRIAPGEETVYLFSGLLRCCECNQNMIRKTVRVAEKKYIYFVGFFVGIVG